MDKLRGAAWRMVLWLAALCCALTARGADPLVDSAATAISQLIDPARLARLPDDATVEAQLGPALGWLHVARRHDVSPEAVIARALALNGTLTPDQARATRESLLRNLARADAWDLFTHADSAGALAYGRPALIRAGLHHGRYGRATLACVVGGVLLEPQYPPGGWDFGCLTLRADDEPLPRPLPGQRRRVRQTGDQMAGVSAAAGPVPRKAGRGRKKEGSHVPPPPIIYEDPLPVADP